MTHFDAAACGRRVRKLRNAKQIKMAALAVGSGMSVTALYELERGARQDMHCSSLLGIAATLGVCPLELLLAESDPAEAA